MTIRTVTKSLAGMEDLAAGIGNVVQQRGGTQVTVGKIDQAYTVLTEQDLADLDVTKFTFARLDGFNYEYDAEDNSGVPSNVGPGSWIRDRGGNFNTVNALASLGDSLVSGGNIQPIDPKLSFALGPQSTEIGVGTTRLIVNTGATNVLLYLLRVSGDFAASAHTISSIVSNGDSTYTVVTNVDTYMFVEANSGMSAGPIGDETNPRTLAEHFGDVVNARDYMLVGQQYVDADAVQRAVDSLNFASGYVEIPDTFDSSGNVIELQFDKPVNFYQGQYIFGGSKRGTRILRTGSAVAGITVSNDQGGGETYTYDKISAFNIIMPDDDVARHVGLSNMQVSGTALSNSTAVDCPRIAYAHFENMESRLFTNFYRQDFNSFVVTFVNIRSNDTNVHWQIDGGGSYHSLYNCYGNGAPTAGIGVQANNCSNMQFYDCPMDSIGTGYLFSGTTSANIFGGGVEARLNHVRTLDTAECYIYGGSWPLTVIGDQADQAARVLRAEDSSRIVMKGGRSWLYDFTGGSIDRAAKAFAVATNSAEIVFEDVTARAEDLPADILAWDFLGADARSELSGKLTYIDKGRIKKSSNKEAIDVVSTGLFPEKQVVILPKQYNNGDASVTLFTSSVLAYGDGISGEAIIRAQGAQFGGVSILGESKVGFTAAERNSATTKITVINDGISGYDDNLEGFDITIGITGSQIRLVATPKNPGYGDVVFETEVTYTSINSSGTTKEVELT